jgi:hypothetical protein
VRVGRERGCADDLKPELAQGQEREERDEERPQSPDRAIGQDVRSRSTVYPPRVRTAMCA